MPDRVPDVFAGCTPAQVGRPVVCGDAIEMSAHIACGTLSNEGFQNQLMDWLYMGFDRLATVTDINTKVTTMGSLRQSPHITAAVGINMTVTASEVTGVLRNWFHLHYLPNDHHVQHGFWNDRTYKVQSDCLLYECRPVPGGFCDELLLWVSVGLLSGRPRTADAAVHNCHESASMLGHNGGGQRDPGHIFRSVLLPALHDPHRTDHASVWGSRGKNMVAWVYLAHLSSFRKISRSL